LGAGESDQCITANACQSKNAGGHGFYNKELFLKPLTAGQELLDGLKNGTLKTVTDSQGEEIFIKFINLSPFDLRAYLKDNMGMEKDYQDIPKNSTRIRSTFLDYKWLVRSSGAINVETTNEGIGELGG
jgi:hypothetical protein